MDPEARAAGLEAIKKAEAVEQPGAVGGAEPRESLGEGGASAAALQANS